MLFLKERAATLSHTHSNVSMVPAINITSVVNSGFLLVMSYSERGIRLSCSHSLFSECVPKDFNHQIHGHKDMG